MRRRMNIQKVMSAVVGLVCLLGAPSWGQVARSGNEGTTEKVVVVGGSSARAPYQFLNDEGEAAGFDIDLIRAVAAGGDLKIDVRLSSVSNAVIDLYEGRVDMIAGMHASEGDQSRMDFARPSLSVEYGVFVGADSSMELAEEMKGKVIVVVRGDVGQKYVLDRSLTEKVTAVETVDDALGLLTYGNYDCAVLPIAEATGLLGGQGTSGVRRLGEELFRSEYGFAVRKGELGLVERLNEGLGRVMSDGTHKSLHERWFLGEKEGEQVDVAQVVVVGVVVAGMVVVLGLMVGAIGWARRREKQASIGLVRLQKELDELRRVEETVRAEKYSLLSLLKDAPHGVLVLTGGERDSEIIYCNPAATRITGYAMEDVGDDIPAFIERVFPDAEYRERVVKRWERLAKDSFREGGFTVALAGQDGVMRRLDFQSSRIGGGRVILMFSDVTQKYNEEQEHQDLDEDIRQSQKLQAMGQLAGGIAHDFNNILTSVLGNAQMLQMEVEDEDSEQAEMLAQIVNASKRAGDLTRQLLAYARKGKFQVEQVDVHETIHDVIGLLKHSVDKRIELQQELTAGRPLIMGDPTQLQGALLNLGVNARDAMPDGGALRFETRMVSVDKEMCRKRSYDIVPGEYLQVRVTDTGTGMTEEVKARIFEPFFTTKEQGKGTGLGLAAVYGCVKNHHGTVVVKTEIGKGTEFMILLPTVGAKKVEPKDEGKEVVKGKGHILLVDDEEGVRRITARALRRLGYKLSLCEDGEEAVEFMKKNHADVDIVVMDLIMPKMDGRTAFREMKKMDPGVRVIVMSGFAAESTAGECLHEGAVDFIAKPFWIGDLSQAVATYMKKN